MARLPRRWRTLTVLVPLALAVAALPAAAAAGSSGLAVASTAPLPTVVPTPQSITGTGSDLRVPSQAVIVADRDTDASATSLARTLLLQHGASSVQVVAPGTVRPRAGRLVVLLGNGDRSDISSALGATTVPAQAEGYALRVLSSSVSSGIVIGGRDGAGQYYGVQTLRQLFLRSGAGWRVAGATVRDYPKMALRGAIEGFYGPPWSTAERLHQIAFLGDVKANSYIYSAKADPYLRDQWRDPYPKKQLRTLGTLVDAATAHHVDFTYALSPGVSICFSSKADQAALLAKFQSVYDLGVRSFSIPFDDISYTKWNCAADQRTFGDPGQATAGAAQVSLLNLVTERFIDTHDGAQPLQTVPTEYSDLKDSPYKTELREHLDPSVVVQWTGTAVVPPTVTDAQARQVSKVYGRKVFLWDNYPVNDFTQAAGRLPMAPYVGRQDGLSRYLDGIVSNPMNNEVPSEVAEYGVADFSWNDEAYDAQRTWHAAFDYLAGGDPTAAQALAVFADLEHYAPLFGPDPWQPQAPVLAARTAAFWRQWRAGDHSAAARTLRAYALQIQSAPAVIADGNVPHAFTTEAKPWLTATRLWGAAMVDQLDALTAADSGDTATAKKLTAQADSLVAKASAIHSDPRVNNWDVPVKVGDGVLDTFISRARRATLSAS